MKRNNVILSALEYEFTVNDRDVVVAATCEMDSDGDSFTVWTVHGAIMLHRRGCERSVSMAKEVLILFLGVRNYLSSSVICWSVIGFLDIMDKDKSQLKKRIVLARSRGNGSGEPKVRLVNIEVVYGRKSLGGQTELKSVPFVNDEDFFVNVFFRNYKLLS